MAKAKGTSTKGVIAIALAAALVAGGVVFAWKNGQVSSLQTEATTARAAAVKATAHSEELESKLAKTTLALRHQERKNTKAEEEVTEAESSPSPEPSSETDLADGKWYGQIKGAQSSPPQITVDVKQFLTGKAAEKAAKKDGTEAMNDYYIVNDSTKLRTLSVKSDAVVKILQGNGNTTKFETITFTELVNRFNSSGKNQTSLHDLGFWFWLSSGEVIKLEQQFVP